MHISDFFSLVYSSNINHSAINNNVKLKHVTGYNSSHYTYTFHSLHYLYPQIDQAFTHLTHDPWAETANENHCLTEILLLREIRNSHLEALL